MTINELKLKVKSANDKISKIESTIEKHELAMNKKLNEIQAKGYDENDVYCRYGTEQHHEAYWLICEYNEKLEAIKNNLSKLEDAKRIAENWEIKLEKQNQIESTITNELPECFIQLQTELIERWTNHDIEKRERMKQLKKEMEYKEFRKLYSYAKEQLFNMTDEEIKRKATFDSECFVIDLYIRVKNAIGQPTDYSNIRYQMNCLNGFIIGEHGKCEVETIIAGGYNIQREHYRVLVKKL